jgi:hypothetical protein
MGALTPLRPTRAVSTLRMPATTSSSRIFGDAEGWLGQRFDSRAPSAPTA